MAIAQKQVPEKEHHDAEEVFDKLSAKYGFSIILPTGSALDGRLMFQDFYSNHVQSFHLPNLPKVQADKTGKKEDTPLLKALTSKMDTKEDLPLLKEMTENLTKAFSEYNPRMKNYAFTVVPGSVEYVPERGLLTFSLKLVELTMIAQK